MRRYTVLVTLALTFSLLIGIQVVTTQVRANVIAANVDIDPDSLLLKEGGHGMWITAHIGFPEGYDVNNVNVSSVMLDVMGSHVPVSKSDIQGDILMVKFDRAMVTSFLWSMVEHMSPHVKSAVTLTVTGSLNDGDTFEGSDTINVFYTHI